MSVHSQVLVAMSNNNQNESSIENSNQIDGENQLETIKQTNLKEQINQKSNRLTNESNLQDSSNKKSNSSINELSSSNNSSLTSSLNCSKNNYNNDSNNSNVSSKLNFDTISSSKDQLKLDLFPNVIFNLKELFRLSIKFTKDNENKAFHPTYDDRNLLYALNYQIKFGTFNEQKAPQPGALDFVGKDRRLAWKSLGNLSEEDAMKQFIIELNRICPTFKPFIEAHNQEKIERERLIKEEEEKKRVEEEKILKEEEEERLKNAEVERKERKRQEVREALKKQTFYQFQSYAQQQYPNDQAAQEQLIKSLEELHYQQFVQQIMQFQEQNPLSSNGDHQINSEQQDTNELIDGMQKFNLNGNKLDKVSTNSSTSLPNSTSNNLTNNLDNQFNKMNQQDFVNNQRYLVEHEESNEETEEEEDEENSEEVDTDNESTSVEYDNNYEGKCVQVAAPQMWTKKIIKQFKESISIDSGDGIIKIGYGETLTIRVPTHPDGNCIVWEFATDNYDIGFGLFFTPNENPGNQVTIQVSESEDEEEDGNESSDLERGASAKECKRPNKTQYVLPIIPVYRRDSYEEVFCGSHVYPGKGTYLLKFDNTYSLWRSKTLYYRVFFSS